MQIDQKRYVPGPFRPSRWLRGPHAQTIVGRYLRQRLRTPLRRERIETDDGDFLDLDIPPEPPEAAPDAPVALVLHGLEGRAASGYMLALYGYLGELGVHAVGLNFRSCGGEVNRLARSYHAGETSDVETALEWVRRNHPGRSIVAIGFSLGGNVLLKYLGERGEAASDVIRAAATISVPFDLAAGATHLERWGMARVYSGYLLRKLLRKARDKSHLLEGLCDLSRLEATRTIRGFDELVTAPLYGFRDAAHYYAESSSARLLHGIRVPTLLLHALDDPFFPRSALPADAIEANPFLHEAFSAAGGHVGFVAGSPWRPVFWAEREAARFVAHNSKLNMDSVLDG